ncbi:MAG TPA: NAD(P)/FAD-dependent oxidoreductase [Gemmatimonadaceae bacterium]|nr:NAD(P)/FAD-dependent oxidoreductase [Gemmatimonadaceae bacterium]
MSSEHSSVDVIIVGAGAAGLAAARVLRESGVEFAVLEARERIGGRIFTRHDSSLAVPIELGAEFVHGVAPELREIARDAALAILDNGGQRWQSNGHRWRRFDEFWPLLNEIMSRLDAHRDPDRSFEQFLNTRPGGTRLARARALALQFVKGFHAADPARASERALAEGGSPGDDVRERRIGRFAGGYESVAAWLSRDLGSQITLGSVVTAIHWERGAVRVDARQSAGDAISDLRARAAIVSVPIGVLQAPRGETGAIAFHPSLDKARTKADALRGMEMGAVTRLTLQLREAFWTSERFMRRTKSQDLDRLAFLQSADPDFPVWWTAYPVSAPMLIAWTGSTRARELASLDEDEVIDRAIGALGRQFRLAPREARRMVTAAWTHNWVNDPYSRGAYSYMVVGGSDSPAKLARPVHGTLFFAGEASDAEARTGTVHGAIASGRRAAKQALRALDSRARHR